VLLDDHQTRFLAEEDFIRGSLFDAGTAKLIQDGQQGRGSTLGLLGQAAELGHAGRLPLLGRLCGEGLGHEHDQQAAADRQADAFGLSGAGEGGAAVVVEEEGVGEQVLQLSDAASQVVHLVTQLLELSLGVVAMEGLQDGSGVAVERLPGQAESVSVLGDGAVGAMENDGGVGDTQLGG
jgi:hypothetical protein